MIERTTGLHASFHDLIGITYIIREFSLTQEYRSHHNPFCEARKRGDMFQKCIRCKYVTNFMARKKRHDFCGVCYAGVWDFVSPVFFGDVFLGTLFVGGARGTTDSRPDHDNALFGELPPMPTLKPEELGRLARAVSEFIGCCLRSHGVSPQFLDLLNRKKERLDARPVHWLVRMAIRFIEEHYNEQLSLSLIGRHLKVRPQYLCRIFSENQGVSLTQFIHRVRICRAKELLLTGRFNVTEVAMRVGFDDSSYFTRIFHKVEGKSPSDFLTGNV